MMKGVNLQFTATNRAAPAMKQFQGGLTGTKRQLNATAVANKRFSESLGRSTWRRQVQQAGMQVSDFSVQVAGGQSAILAFTQNFPQFVQNFGAMGGVLAAAITILGTFAFMASRAGGAVKEFSKQIDETKGAVDEYFSMLRANKGLTATLFSEAEESLQRTSQAAKDLTAIAKIEAIRSIENLAKSLANASTEAGIMSKLMFEGDRAVTGNLLGIDTALNGHIGKWKDAAGRVQEFIDVTRGIGNAGDIDAMLEQAIRARDIFKENVDVTGDMTAEQIKFWKQLSQTIQQLELMGAAVKAETTAASGNFELLTRAVAKFNDERFAGNESAREMLSTMQKEVEVMRAVALHGADSAQVTKLRASHERAALEETLRTMNASDDLKNALRAALETKITLTEQTAKWAKAMGAVRQELSAIMSGLNNLAGGAIGNAAKRVELTALKQGKGIAEAAREQQKFRKELEFTARLQAAQAKGGIAGFTQATLVKAERAQFRAGMALDAQLEAARDVAREAERAASRSGRSAATAAEKAKKKFDELLNTAGPQLRRLLGEVNNLTLESAERIKKIFEDIQGSISTSMSSSFKALLRGTESFQDAMLNVLNTILDKIFDLVMTPIFDGIAGSISGSIMRTFGFARGTKNAPGGFTRVNERGGEMAVLPGGTQVIPADLSRRMADNMSGGGGIDGPLTVVNVINQSGDAKVEQRRRRDSNGRETVDVIISESIALGRQDSALGQRTGAQPRVARR